MQPIKAQHMDADELSAWFDGRIPRRLLAIPFGGPLGGKDLDGEYFSPRTDIKAAWLPFRVVDWHHGRDEIMGRTALGKADNLELAEDGWWVDVWFAHGEKRIELIRKLAERGAQLFGSSESVAGMVRKADDGEILVWPYWRQTLSTSPQNTFSALRPFKAAIEDAVSDYQPGPTFWADLETAWRSLTPELRRGFTSGSDTVKAGDALAAVQPLIAPESYAALEAAVTRLLAAPNP